MILFLELHSIVEKLIENIYKHNVDTNGNVEMLNTLSYVLSWSSFINMSYAIHNQRLSRRSYDNKCHVTEIYLNIWDEKQRTAWR